MHLKTPLISTLVDSQVVWYMVKLGPVRDSLEMSCCRKTTSSERQCPSGLSLILPHIINLLPMSDSILFSCNSSSRCWHLPLVQLGSPKLPAAMFDFVSASSVLPASSLDRVCLGTCWRGPVLDTSVSDILLFARIEEYLHHITSRSSSSSVQP
jgi:hypothetical protein